MAEVSTPVWAIIGCDHEVTIEVTGVDPDALADLAAPWAQQEADKWPQFGLVYMLVQLPVETVDG